MVNTTCYVIYRVLLKHILNKTSYEILFGKKVIVGYFKIFYCKSFILNIKEHLEKFDKKTDEGIFLNYCENKHEYRVYNRRTLVIEETIYVTFDEINDVIFKSMCEDDDVGVQQELENLTINDVKST